MQDLAEFLNTYGGWGLSAILMIVVKVLYTAQRTCGTDTITELKQFNDRLTTMIERKIEIDIKQEEALRNLREVVKELKDGKRD